MGQHAEIYDRPTHTTEATEASNASSASEAARRLGEDARSLSGNTASANTDSSATSPSSRSVLPELTLEDQSRKSLATGIDLVRKNFDTVDKNHDNFVNRDELAQFRANPKLSSAEQKGLDLLSSHLRTVAGQHSDKGSDDGWLWNPHASKADLNVSAGLNADAPLPVKESPEEKHTVPVKPESPKTAEEKLADGKTPIEEKLKILEDFDKKGIHKITLKDADGKQRDYEIEVENFGKGKKGIYLFTNDDSGHNQTVLRANKIGDKYSAQQDEQGKDVSMTVWQPPKKAHSRK